MPAAGTASIRLSPLSPVAATVSGMPGPRRRTAASLVLAPALAVAAAVGALAGPAGATDRDPTLPTWQLRPVDSEEQFRGLDAVSRDVAWVGGSNGSVFRTVDGGDRWREVSPADSSGLVLRDVEAFDRDHALVLAIGTGDASRVYRTDNGGRMWTRTFTNHDPAAFYDCMTFLDRDRGLALSDPVDGRFRIIATRDGGRSWSVQPRSAMPAALAGEFAFAASGTCLTSTGRRDAWFGTGGGERARVFHSRDGGRTWTVADTPLLSAEAGGIFSLAFRDRRRGLAVGGDFTTTGPAERALAITRDGGTTWRLVPAEDAPEFYRSGSAWVRGRPRTAIVVGPTGSDISVNGGERWTAFGQTTPTGEPVGGFDSVECARDGACWASEQHGKVARLAWPRR